MVEFLQNLASVATPAIVAAAATIAGIKISMRAKKDLKREQEQKIQDESDKNYQNSLIASQTKILLDERQTINAQVQQFIIQLQNEIVSLKEERVKSERATAQQKVRTEEILKEMAGLKEDLANLKLELHQWQKGMFAPSGYKLIKVENYEEGS